MAEGVDLVAAGEVDVVDLVDHVAEQVAVDHAVDRALVITSYSIHYTKLYEARTTEPSGSSVTD